MGIRNIIIEPEGDNLVAIQSIKYIWKILWPINAIILDADEDLKMFEDVQIWHVFREANTAADWLAHMSHSTTNFTYRFDVSNIPFFLIIRHDALVWLISWKPP